MRLESTKRFFENKIRTNTHLLVKHESQLKNEEARLNLLSGALKRSTNLKTQQKIHSSMHEYATQSGHVLGKFISKDKTLASIESFKRKNTFLSHQSVHHSIVNLCIVFEQYIRTILLKYYEEDIRRLISEKESLKNSDLIKLITSGDSIHYTLAEKIVDSKMYASVEVWYKFLDEIGFDVHISSDIQEMFLVRNCLVHNNEKVSIYLSDKFSSYRFRSKIEMKSEDYERFRIATNKTFKYLAYEYTRLFPVNTGTWVDIKS